VKVDHFKQDVFKYKQNTLVLNHDESHNKMTTLTEPKGKPQTAIMASQHDNDC